MDDKSKNTSKFFGSLKKFLSKPVIKTDSKLIEYSGIGVQLSATILVFLFAGIWLDGKFNTKILFTIIFVVIGFIGGFYKLYLTVKELEKKNNKPKN